MYDPYRQQQQFPFPVFPGQNINRRVDRLERQVQRLENQLNRVERRLDRIERRLGIFGSSNF